jgi:hypothetical protein
MPLPPFLANIVGWLRAGYPDGVPEHDYLPLFALLGSQLTEEELVEIASELEGENNPQSSEAIKRAINAATPNNHPGEADIARVRARLAAGGWPLAVPPRD